MITRITFVASLVAMFLFASGSVRSTATAEARQQDQAQHAEHHDQPQSPAPDATKMPGMMKMHEQMMAQMKAEDAKLDTLVKDMNSATGNAKMDAIAAAVNELARQHKGMHAHMAQMGQNMMGGRGMTMGR